MLQPPPDACGNKSGGRYLQCGAELFDNLIRVLELLRGEVDVVENTEQNKSFLEQVPHREFQDLSIIYKLVVNADAESIQSIRVTNSLAERLGTNEE